MDFGSIQFRMLIALQVSYGSPQSETIDLRDAVVAARGQVRVAASRRLLLDMEGLEDDDSRVLGISQQRAEEGSEGLERIGRPAAVSFPARLCDACYQEYHVRNDVIDRHLYEDQVGVLEKILVLCGQR